MGDEPARVKSLLERSRFLWLNTRLDPAAELKYGWAQVASGVGFAGGSASFEAGLGGFYAAVGPRVCLWLLDFCIRSRFGLRCRCEV